MRIIICLLLCLSTSLVSAQLVPEAILKNNQAVKTVNGHSHNPDSYEAIYYGNDESFL